jgi:hypothetical protein
MYELSNLISVYCSLSLYKKFVNVRGLLGSLVIFYGERMLAPRQTPRWKTIPCRLFRAAYVMYSQLPFIEAIPLSLMKLTQSYFDIDLKEVQRI